jgi:hypothetical protein
VRARGEALAEPGPAALSQRLDEAHAWLEEHLLLEPPGRRLRVFAGKTLGRRERDLGEVLRVI